MELKQTYETCMKGVDLIKRRLDTLQAMVTTLLCMLDATKTCTRRTSYITSKIEAMLSEPTAESFEEVSTEVTGMILEETRLEKIAIPEHVKSSILYLAGKMPILASEERFEGAKEAIHRTLLSYLGGGVSVESACAIMFETLLSLR
jgi:hypothetical protein